MEPGPITLCAASIQPIAASGRSASRLSTTKISRSGVGPDADGRPILRAERRQERARGYRRSMAGLEEIPAPVARTDVLPPARWLADSARLAAASASVVSAATR